MICIVEIRLCLTSLLVRIQNMLIWCACKCRTKRMVPEEIEADRMEMTEIEIWTEEQCLSVRMTATIKWIVKDW